MKKYLSIALILVGVGCKDKPDILKSPNDFSMEGYNIGYRIAKLHTADSLHKFYALKIDSLKKVIADMKERDRMIIIGGYEKNEIPEPGTTITGVWPPYDSTKIDTSIHGIIQVY